MTLLKFFATRSHGGEPLTSLKRITKMFAMLLVCVRSSADLVGGTFIKRKYYRCSNCSGKGKHIGFISCGPCGGNGFFEEDESGHKYAVTKRSNAMCFKQEGNETTLWWDSSERLNKEEFKPLHTTKVPSVGQRCWGNVPEHTGIIRSSGGDTPEQWTRAIVRKFEVSSTGEPKIMIQFNGGHTHVTVNNILPDQSEEELQLLLAKMRIQREQEATRRLSATEITQRASSDYGFLALLPLVALLVFLILYRYVRRKLRVLREPLIPLYEKTEGNAKSPDVGIQED